MGTTRLGLGATYSTTYYHPFHVARLFQTLDLMTRGRAAWNVVTSMNDVEARNMGLEEAVEHDARYDRADEFLEVVHGHWDTWADDALIVDKTTGRFADPEKVRRLDHKGEHFRSRGPFTVPRSPQGHPVRHPGRPERPRPPLRRAMGRADLHEQPRSRARQEGLCGAQGRRRRARPQSRPA